MFRAVDPEAEGQGVMELMIFSPDGTARGLDTHTLDLESFGQVQRKRASYVEPFDPALRLAFHGLRWMFGEVGRVADWTRRWPCVWQVRIIGGPTLPWAWRVRAEAIAAEVEYLYGRMEEAWPSATGMAPRSLMA